MYRNSESVTELIQRIIETESPVYSSTSSQVSPLSGEFEEIQHRIWTIVGPADIEDLDRAFESIDSLYIADGHHRTGISSNTFISINTILNVNDLIGVNVHAEINPILILTTYDCDF